MSTNLLCQELVSINYLWQSTCVTLGVVFNFDVAQQNAERKEFAAALMKLPVDFKPQSLFVSRLSFAVTNETSISFGAPFSQMGKG